VRSKCGPSATLVRSKCGPAAVTAHPSMALSN
jgi:hypothetical protein